MTWGVGLCGLPANALFFYRSILQEKDDEGLTPSLRFLPPEAVACRPVMRLPCRCTHLF